MPVTSPIARALVQAREAKGLSQRELAKRAGMTQAQISKIESRGAGLTVSSLTELARALDLELALVPLKLMPAVDGLTRSLTADSRTSPELVRQLKRLKAAAQALQVRVPHLAGVAELAHLTNAISHNHLPDGAAPTIEEIAHQIIRTGTQRRMLTTDKEHIASILRKLNDLRLALALAEEPGAAPRPAYALEDTDE